MLATISLDGQPYRRLEQRPGRRMLTVVNCVNECDWGDARTVYRFLQIYTAAVDHVAAVSIRLHESVAIEQVPGHLVPFVLRREAQ